MWNDDCFGQFNFKFSQCNLLDEDITTSDAPSTNRKQNKKKTKISEEQIAQPMNAIEENVSFFL
jgi:hypothetical protein